LPRKDAGVLEDDDVKAAEEAEGGVDNSIDIF
jgi:hypothetical protein